MFEKVLKQSIEDQQRSDKIIAYAQYYNRPIWGAMETLYGIATKDDSEEFLADLGNAIIITDRIYWSLP